MSTRVAMSANVLDATPERLAEAVRNWLSPTDRLFIVQALKRPNAPEVLRARSAQTAGVIMTQDEVARWVLSVAKEITQRGAA